MTKGALRSLRKTRVICWFRSLLPHWLVNAAWHFPKALLANLLYRFPAKKMTVIGVTGTKGKTSTAHMIYHILIKEGRKVVLISTVSASFAGKEVETGFHVTNPGPFTLQKLLRQATKQGLNYAVIETTSHGLAQFRNWGIKFALGVFTQVRSDHTAYHGGVKEYRKVKAKLIKMSGKIVLNELDPSFEFLKSRAKRLSVPLVTYKGSRESFQSQNLEAAIAAAGELGISKATAKKALKSFPGIPGRMEIIQKDPFTAVIDFAHTSDSLEAALKKLRSLVEGKGRLIAVFGCAGERDPSRRKMGAVAAKLSDFFIITAEDPRTEGVEKISREIAKHACSGGAKEVSLDEVSRLKRFDKGAFVRIPDREKAIDCAIAHAKPGDVIGFFGKGHEKSICIGMTEYPWSEAEAVARALERREKR